MTIRDRRFLFAFCLFSFTLISSCHDLNDAATNVSLNIKLSYDGEALPAFETKDYGIKSRVFFTKYSFFLSDIVAIGKSGSEKLSDVLFVDLLKDVNSRDLAEKGFSAKLEQIPAGNYMGLRFHIGIRPELNKTKPAEYESANPLSNNAEYWVGWSSYIFNKLEGKLDEDGDGLFETNIALHLGSDMAFRTVDINQAFTLREGSDTITVELDLKKILTINGAFFDLMKTHQIHSIEQLPDGLGILDNCLDKFVLISGI